jgi:hypothetical protein
MMLVATHKTTGIELISEYINDIELNVIGGTNDEIDYRVEKIKIHSKVFDFKIKQLGFTNYQIQAIFRSQM